MAHGPAFEVPRTAVPGSSAGPGFGAPMTVHEVPLAAESRDGLATWLRRFALHLIPYLLIPQTWGLGLWAIGRVFDPSLARPDLSALAPIPGRLVVFHLLIAAAAFLPQTLRLWAIAFGALAAGFGLKIIDPGSVAMFTAICAASYPLVRTRRLRLKSKLLLSFIVVGASRLAAQQLGFETLGRPDIAVGFVVCLWYACYSTSSVRDYRLRDHLGYTQIRLFTEGPVFPLGDARPASPRALLEPAIRTLSWAIVARTVSFQLRLLLNSFAWHETTGLTLLGCSYLNYIALSCDVVFGYNLTLGLLRMMGLPIADNFGNWILARTPNEHWRRWNLLYREWLLTFTFYPLMRRRRSLFVCVMAALLASGGMHLFAHLGDRGMGFEKALLTLLYWTINGLAIYTVLAIPRRWPAAVARLRLADGWAWWFTGWLATSIFYAVLFLATKECSSFAEVGGYLVRLLS